MDPKHLAVDERLTGIDVCAYCGRSVSLNRDKKDGDHAPSRILLDKPYPSNLPTVDACRECNSSFSKDEEYVACFLECAIFGSTSVDDLQRTKIKNALMHSPSLQSQIESSKQVDLFGGVTFRLDTDRMTNVVLKLARGHMAYDLYPRIDDPIWLGFAPIHTFDSDRRRSFEDGILDDPNILPEFGTRAFFRGVVTRADVPNSPVFYRNDWVVIQPNRYRYAVSPQKSLVRIVLSEYLACEVIWEDVGGYGFGGGDWHFSSKDDSTIRNSLLQF